MSKFVLATLLLALFILSPSILQLGQAQSLSAAPVPPPDFCDTKCEERCSKAGEKKRCLRYCGICCQQCHCVPSGTFGNKSECPCYRDKLNTKGTSKCP